MKGMGMLIVGLGIGFLTGALFERRRSESPEHRAERLTDTIEEKLERLEQRVFGDRHPPVRTADGMH